MPPQTGMLPAAAVEHMSAIARIHLPQHLRDQVADEGIYSDTGLYGAGPGWYHIGTSADQLFLGHEGEADYFVFDFDVLANGTGRPQGFDVATQFERALDGIIVLNTFAETGPGESYGVVAEGVGPKSGLEDRVHYTLVQLRFEGPVAVETEIARLGTFGFGELV
ncbi:hypothetical protein [Phenylobacterium sp.]|uniref:hypothetical protein n=1 Tax=Phenylobacterium sp. TaxID=1871053 RepID=UPI002ED925F6